MVEAMKNAIAIITARGGSKRIPYKNIKEFCGRPIIEYSIEAAIESDLFDEVMVSTDDDRISEISKKSGANVPFKRSPQNSDDFSTTADVIKEVIEKYKEKGIEFKFICCIYPTAPFVTKQKLIEAMDKLESLDADSIMPVVKYSFPPQRAFVLENEYISYQYPEFAKTRSQDLEPIYHDTGQFYISKTDKFLLNNSLVTKKTIPFIVKENEVQDIDDYSDWEIAEIKYKAMKKNINQTI